MQDQRWEYLEIYLAGRDWADSTGASGELEVASVGAYSHVNTNELLDDLGSVGWELVSVVSGQLHGTYKLYLKRPFGDDGGDEGEADEGDGEADT